MMGQRALTLIVIVLAAVIALPTVLIYLFKAPPPLRDVAVFGLSYYKLLFLFNLSAVLLLVSAVLSLRAKLPVVATTLILALFSSTPLIIGLRQGLTMQQAMLEISFFAGWPFFLQPLYLLAVILLPAGVLLFATLQLRNLFSQQEHSFAFGGAALFLALACLFGQYEVSRAGQPTLMALFPSRPAAKTMVAGKETPQPRELATVRPAPPATPNPLPPAQPRELAAKSPIVEGGGQTAGQQTTLPLAPPAATTPPAAVAHGPELEVASHKLVTQLQGMDAKLSALARLQAKDGEKWRLELTTLGYRLEALSSKLDAILLQLEASPQDPRGQTPPSPEPPPPAGAATPLPQGAQVPPPTTGPAALP